MHLCMYVCMHVCMYPFLYITQEPSQLGAEEPPASPLRMPRPAQTPPRSPAAAAAQPDAGESPTAPLRAEHVEGVVAEPAQTQPGSPGAAPQREAEEVAAAPPQVGAPPAVEGHGHEHGDGGRDAGSTLDMPVASGPCGGEETPCATSPPRGLQAAAGHQEPPVAEHLGRVASEPAQIAAPQIHADEAPAAPLGAGEGLALEEPPVAEHLGSVAAEGAVDFDEEARKLYARLNLDPSKPALNEIWKHPSGGTLYVGNETAARELQLLRQYGIAHVVNCTNNLPLYHENDITYLRFTIGCLKHRHDNEICALAQNMVVFVESALSQGKHALLHCRAGVHRAGATSVICLMHFAKLPVVDAVRAAKSRRPIIDPSRLMSILWKWERRRKRRRPE